MLNLDDLINDARLPEGTYDLCLRADLQAELEAKQLELAAAVDEDSLGVDTGDLGAEIELLREQMAGSVVKLRLRGLGRQRWAALQKQFPPRDDDRLDAVCGYNYDEFMPAAIRECIVEPAISATQWDKLLNLMTDGQYTALQKIMLRLNTKDVQVPL